MIVNAFASQKARHLIALTGFNYFVILFGMDQSLIEQVTVENISLSNLGFVIFLKRENSDDVLPIFIAAPEAHSIAAAYNNHKFPRPLSHDLFKNILELLDCTITKVIITELVESTFYARIYLRKNDENFQIDARPSDAIALALRFRAEIFVSKAVLDGAAISLGNEEVFEADNSSVENLRTELEKAVSEERYEDAARLRDELKNQESDN